MNIALWILFGALVGWIASLVINNVDTRHAELMTVLGVVGGIVGGWITNVLCNGSVNNFNIYSVLSAVLVAGICIWFYDKRFLTPHK